MQSRAFSLAFVAVMLIVEARLGLAVDSKFHPAQTEAEKVLDKILNLEGKDSNLFFFVLGQPWYDSAKDMGYARFFTKALLSSWRKKEAELVRENCNGKYREGEICGFDYSPITCGQDRPDEFVYRTLKSKKESAAVMAAWALDNGQIAFPIRYILIYGQSVWKLDGVDCGEGGRFNIRTSK